MTQRLVVCSVDLRPPIYVNVQRVVRRFVPNTEVKVEQGENPVRRLLGVVFPGWKLQIYGWHGCLEENAFWFMADNPIDDGFRFREPPVLSEANLLVTFKLVEP